MTDTTWNCTLAHGPSRPAPRSMARLWQAWVVAPLHCALDSALRAGELRGLDSGTLADIGYRRD